MLRLLVGKARTGKTATMIKEIAAAVEKRQGGRLVIVPEQYSHEAERELCAACGDSMSLYAEVFSFTGLARRVMSICGGGAAKYMDKGGRLLCMALAADRVRTQLRVYGSSCRKAETQEMLLAALDELKTACITPDMLIGAAEQIGGSLGDKLNDMALISEAYDAAVSGSAADPVDRLSAVVQSVYDAHLGAGKTIYVDGFIDFTRQEQQLLEALLITGAELTVCMTIDSLDGVNEVYELSRRACRKLLAMAKERGIDCAIETAEKEQTGPLGYFADNMFNYGAEEYPDAAPITLHTAESIGAECEFAAARALELARERGCRWRDIAVAVRGFEDYREALENAFLLYGVPLYTARRSEIMAKPLPALIAGAYEIVQNGWDTDELISYMGTGLTGLSLDECDELSNYIFMWQLRSGAWLRESDWRQHPDGYGGEYDEETEQRLQRINALRRRIAEPLIALQQRSNQARTAHEQAVALSRFLEELELPQRLTERAQELDESGREELSQEYRQLWGIIINALEQSAAILGDMEMSGAEYAKLFMLSLSKYDVGTIPVSLDRVSAGDFDRMRRRSIKQLIVLGCSDERLPMAQENAGVFSDDERERLAGEGIELGAGSGELWREFSLIYNCLSLPSQGLDLCMSQSGGDGGALRPASVYNRAAEMFRLDPQPVDIDDCRLSAPAPAISLAANAFHGGSGAAAAAAEYFRLNDAQRYSRLKAAAQMSRGRLPPAAVEALYGKKPRMSASKVDRFSKCRFSYFMQYGLNARPYKPAAFTPPEIGTFIHYVMENTIRRVRELGGFKRVDDAALEELCQGVIDKYIHEELFDFGEKSPRFEYLFKRICADAKQIVAATAAELRCSDFEPLELELNFAKARDIPPIELGGEDGTITLTGVADRVDGWVHDGKLYLRVVDYKTGKTEFSLNDVYNGMGLQMLLYLFTLEENGAEHYGASEIVPAGVMYTPARNVLVSMDGEPSEEDVRQAREKELRRSGLVLDDDTLMEAWAAGKDKRYIPAKFSSNGSVKPDSVASLERMGRISRHIKDCLGEMARQIHGGSIEADPFYSSQKELECPKCDFYNACYFSDGENGEHYRILPKLNDKQVWEMLEEVKDNG